MKTSVLFRLRRTALEHVSGQHPDLASLARALGRHIHREGGAITDRLAPLAAHVKTPRRWILSRRHPHIALLAWPGAYHPSLADPADTVWHLDMVLVGALEVRRFRHHDGALETGLRTWLGPADGIWHDSGEPRTYRYRNLSRDHVAWVLQVRQTRPPRVRTAGVHGHARQRPLGGLLSGY